MRLRLILVAAVWGLIGVGAFVWLHSGALGDATCERSRFVPSDGFSAWPPGARCSYGEPAQTDIIFNGWFAAVILVLILTCAVAFARITTRA